MTASALYFVLRGGMDSEMDGVIGSVMDSVMGNLSKTVPKLAGG
jgi:hypothetical protein